MRAEVDAALRSFFAWWRRELAAVLPDRLRRAVWPERARLDARVENGGLVLTTVDGPGRIELPDLASTPPSRRESRRISRMARAAAETVLRLPPERVLRTTIQLPLDAADRLDEALALEMDRHTPFAADDVFYDWRVRSSDMELERLFVDLLVARKADVRQAIALAAQAGLTPDRIDGPPGAGAFDLSPDEPRGRSRRQAADLLRPLAAALVVLAVVWTVLWFERREHDLEAAEARLAELRMQAAEVVALETRIGELAAARSMLDRLKLGGPTAVGVLADVTEAVPDGDWLFSYAQAGMTLRLDGYSDDASRLLGRLEASELLSGAAFAAPVRRDPTLGRDQFSIVASVAGAGASE